jgi:AcrR family transcriptional regulator
VDPSPLTLPGVNPARQKRSREMSEALLEAGQRLLRKHSLATLSVEDICASIGASVGAFYSRFQSKEAYFQALQHLACHRAASWLEGDGAGRSAARRDLPRHCQGQRRLDARL